VPPKLSKSLLQKSLLFYHFRVKNASARWKEKPRKAMKKSPPLLKSEGNF
jgi:hypothetical protein